LTKRTWRSTQRYASWLVFSDKSDCSVGNISNELVFTTFMGSHPALDRVSRSAKAILYPRGPVTLAARGRRGHAVFDGLRKVGV
jgi:hypothetical protein